MTKGIYILHTHCLEEIYGPNTQKEIADLIDITAPPQTKQSVQENPEILRDVEVIFSGWGGPHIDKDFLQHAPNLKAVFYGAGSIKGITSEAFWDCGIQITSGYYVNGIPVAEYTFSQILWCLKRGWQLALTAKRDKKMPPHEEMYGAYGTKVGLVSLGMVGRRVCELLKMTDLQVLAYDPFVSPDAAAELGVELRSLEDIFRECAVVSLHTPWLEETVGMITGEHFRMMKPRATFINTSRGAVVNEPEMIEALQQRPDLFAVLDVTYPEPPEPGSPLYSMDNVILTPHIAGALYGERRRLGRAMLDELKRYLAGQPLKWGIDREKAKILA